VHGEALSEKLVERAVHAEVEMDADEHLRVRIRPLGRDLDGAVGRRTARAGEDVDDIEGAAATETEQHHLHRARPLFHPARFGRPVHDDPMARVRAAGEARAALPRHRCVHALTPLTVRAHP
jgi:hypothetical protein